MAYVGKRRVRTVRLTDSQLDNRSKLAGLKGLGALRKITPLERAISRIWPTGLTGVVGYPGAGKTYWLADYGLRALKRGRPVYANFALAGAERIHVADLSIDSMEDFGLPKGALVLLDECGIWYNSREWKSFKAEDLLLFMQGRKFGHELCWSAQRLGSVDVTIRELTSVVWCSTWYPNPLRPRDPLMFAYHGYRRHLLEEIWEPAGRKFLLPRKRVFESFSSEESVGVRHPSSKRRELHRLGDSGSIRQL